MTPELAVEARAGDLLAAIGSTPLLELDGLPGQPAGVRLFAKLEAANPGASIKDRPVARMLTRALAAGRLEGGRRLLDSSSGNAGIAYAMLGAALGVPVTLVVPGNASQERIARIRAHGAELILTDPLEGYDEALRTAKRLAAEEPERYWYCDQYANEDNWRAHYETTGVELVDEVALRTGAPPDAFVGGVGTGGTITGVGRRLREVRPEATIVCVRPEEFPGIEGLKPLDAPGAIVPAILDRGLIDAQVDVTLEQAADICAALALRGVFAGSSSGAFVFAALELARRGEVSCVATVLSDTGERYLSTGLWEPTA